MLLKKAFSVLLSLTFLFSFIFPDFARAASSPSDVVKNISFSDKTPDNRFGGFARVTSSADFGGDTAVLNIQDFHMHPEVQKNISAVIDILVKQYGIQSIFVEGAYGKVSTEWLSKVKSGYMGGETIENLLNTGTITGAEYYSAVNGKQDFLIGLEDEKIHKANVKRLGYLIEKQEYYDKSIASLQKELDFFQAKYFNSKNKKLSSLVKRHKEGKISAVKYYTLLFNYLKKNSEQSYDVYGTMMPMDMSDYPNICLLLHTYKMQNSLNVSKINKDLQKLVDNLKDRMNFADYKKLLDYTNNLQDTDMLVSYLDAMPKEFKEKNFPQSVSKYIDISNKIKSINPIDVISEERFLVEEIRIALSQNKNELEVSFLSDFFLYFSDYLKTSISADNYVYFKDRFNKFQKMWNKYSFYNKTMSDLQGEFAFLNEYYSVNDNRNEIFIKQIEKNSVLKQGQKNIPVLNDGIEAMLKGKRNIIVCVTGGYHSKGLTELLSDKKISYAVITPGVTGNIDNALANYESVASEQAKIFTQTLSLSLFSQIVSYAISSNNLDAKRFAAKLFISAAQNLENVPFDDIDVFVSILNTAIGNDYTFSYDKDSGEITLSSADGKYSEPFVEVRKNSEGKISIKNKYSSEAEDKVMLKGKGKLFSSEEISKFMKNFGKVLRVGTLDFGTGAIVPKMYSSGVHIINWAAENNLFLDIDAINGPTYEMVERYGLDEEILSENPEVAKYYEQWQNATILKYLKEKDFKSGKMGSMTALLFAVGLLNEFIPVSHDTLREYDRYASQTGEDGSAAVSNAAEVFTNLIKNNPAYKFLSAMKDQYAKSKKDSSIIDRLWKQLEILRDGAKFSADGMTTQEIMDLFTAENALSQDEQILTDMKYGTAGYRAKFGEGLNYTHILVNAQAIAEVAKERFAAAKKEGQLKNRNKVKIFVGYDTRFMSKEFAEIISAVLAANGIEAVLSDVDTPTPAISWLLGASSGEEYDLAVNITASHNPFEYDGIKVNEPFGGQAGGDITGAIEDKIAKVAGGKIKIRYANLESGLNAGNVTIKNDLRQQYVAAYIEMFKRQFNIKNEADFDAFRKKAKNFFFVVDVKSGTTPQYYEDIMTILGITNYEIINDEFDPTFQGEDPNPDKNTALLMKRVNEIKAQNPDAFVYGLATDPDGDRMAVIENGESFTTDQIIVYNAYRLLEKAAQTARETGKKQEVVIAPNLATTGALELLKEYFDKTYPGLLDIKVERTNIGFKWIAEVMKAAKERNPDVILMGAEESGAVVVGGLTLDKDGLVATFGSASLAIDTEETIASTLRHIYSPEVLGWQPQKKMESVKFESMSDLSAKGAYLESVADDKAVQEAFIRQFKHLEGSFKIESIKKIVGTSFEGIQIFTSNPKVLIILRLSGTEPLVKIYAESDSQDLTNKIISSGKNALDNTSAATKAADAAATEIFKRLFEDSLAYKFLSAMKAQYEKKKREPAVIDRLWKQFAMLRNGAGFSADAMTAQEIIDLFSSANALSEDEQVLSEIKYGTAGYRADFGKDLNYVHILVNAQAIAEVAKERFAAAKKEGRLKGRNNAKIFIGYDTRFMSKEFAEIISAVLAANGIEAVLSDVDTPTPAISWLLGNSNGEEYDLAVNITASHNPFFNNGIKVNEPFGGQAGSDITGALESKIRDISAGFIKIRYANLLNGLNSGKVSAKGDLMPEYVQAYLEMFKRQFNIKNDADFKAFKEKTKNFFFVVDVKNGTTPKYYEEIMKALGISNYEILNAEFNPTFGDEDPNPDKNTALLMKRVNEIKAQNPDAFVYGLATDPDGDRMAVIENGESFTTDQIIVYNAYRLLEKAAQTARETGKKQEVVIAPNLATTGALELLKEYFDKTYPGLLDIKVERTNIGFKWIAEVMKAAKERNPDVILMGAEESGAVVVGGLTLDKDGLVATFGSASLAIDTEETIASTLRHIYSPEVLGWQPQKRMIDIALKDKDGKREDKEVKEETGNYLKSVAENERVFEQLKERFEPLKGSFEIERVQKIVGTDFEGIQIFTNNPKVLIIMRLSGTEPKVKVYAESDSKELTDEILATGKNILENVSAMVSPDISGTGYMLEMPGSWAGIRDRADIRSRKNQLKARSRGVALVETRKYLVDITFAPAKFMRMHLFGKADDSVLDGESRNRMYAAIGLSVSSTTSLLFGILTGIAMALTLASTFSTLVCVALSPFIIYLPYSMWFVGSYFSHSDHNYKILKEAKNQINAILAEEKYSNSAEILRKHAESEMLKKEIAGGDITAFIINYPETLRVFDGPAYDAVMRSMTSDIRRTIWKMQNGLLEIGDAGVWQSLMGKASEISAKMTKTLADIFNSDPDKESNLSDIKIFYDSVISGAMQGVTDQKYTDVLVISPDEIGPKMVLQNLNAAPDADINVHFAYDPALLQQVISRINPATTLVIVAPGTSDTDETFENARLAKILMAKKMAESDNHGMLLRDHDGNIISDPSRLDIMVTDMENIDKMRLRRVFEANVKIARLWMESDIAQDYISDEYPMDSKTLWIDIVKGKKNPMFVSDHEKQMLQRRALKRLKEKGVDIDALRGTKRAEIIADIISRDFYVKNASAAELNESANEKDFVKRAEKVAAATVKARRLGAWEENYLQSLSKLTAEYILTGTIKISEEYKALVEIHNERNPRYFLTEKSIEEQIFDLLPFYAIETEELAIREYEWYLQLIDEAYTEELSDFIAQRQFIAPVEIAGINVFNNYKTLPSWGFSGENHKLWMSAGLPVALAVGYDNFEKFLNRNIEVEGEDVLRSGDAGVKVRIKDGYVLSYDIDGTPVFFDTVVPQGDGKERGGVFACAPYFGPAENLPQHGYARNSEWQLVKSDEKGASFVLAGGEGEWTDVSIRNTVSVPSENTFRANLQISNNGKSPVRIAPAYHPFFNVPPNVQNITVYYGNNERLELDMDKDAQALAATMFRDNVKRVEIGDMIIEFTENQNLPKFAIWSNARSDANGNRFICVEPSFAGNAFDVNETRSGAKGEPMALEAGKTAAFGFAFTVKSNSAEIRAGRELGEKLRGTILDPAKSAEFLKGGYMQSGYGVPGGAVINGSFGVVGAQGYYTEGGKEHFLNDVANMRKFFENRKTEMKAFVKTGIGGQHTPFEGIANGFKTLSDDKVRSTTVLGEYELGKDYEAAVRDMLKSMDIGWDQLGIDPSSKSGSTDETMLIYSELLYLQLKYISAAKGIDGERFAEVVFNTLHDVNFVNGRESAGADLFKIDMARFGTNNLIDLLTQRAESAGLDIAREQVKEIFAAVIGNTFFETTNRVTQSRLAAFLTNSGLAGELGDAARNIAEMYDNVGGRWTADLHMMAFLAYYGLDAEAYWNARRNGIQGFIDGNSASIVLANQIIDNNIKDIALIVPDELFWFGKSIEQNFNESIWQAGFANLVVVKQSHWKHQQQNYRNKSERMVINLSGLDVDDSAFNVENIRISLENLDPQEMAELYAFLATLFYGITSTVGDRLIARELIKQGFTPADVDLNNLDNPATKIVQENLYLRQPYVELGKNLLEAVLTALQADERLRPGAIDRAVEAVKAHARAGDMDMQVPNLQTVKNITDMKTLADTIKQAIDYAEANNRKFVPFIYLEGEKFSELRNYLTELGIEWVLQGTGDQHISYQQVLAQPQKYLPFIISFVPEKFQPGRPAIGFAKGYLDGVSPNLVRDYFAEASYKALTNRGGQGFFLRLTDSPENITMLKQAAKAAVSGEQSKGQAIMKENYEKVYGALINGKSVFSVVLRLFITELPEAIRNPKKFVERHADNDKAAAAMFADYSGKLNATAKKFVKNWLFITGVTFAFGASAYIFVPSVAVTVISAFVGMLASFVVPGVTAWLGSAKVYFSIDYKFVENLKKDIDKYSPRMTEKELAQADHIEAIIINSVPENPQELGFKNTGLRTGEGSIIWSSKKTGRLVIFAKDAEYGDIALSAKEIIPAMLNKKGNNFEISAIAVSNRANLPHNINYYDDLLIIKKSYYDELLAMSGYDVKTAGEKIRNKQKASLSSPGRNFIMDASRIDSEQNVNDVIRALSGYNRTGNGQIAIPYSMLERMAVGEFNILSKGGAVNAAERDAKIEEIKKQILNEWADAGIRVFAVIDEQTKDADNLKVKFIEYGFSGYIERKGGKIAELRDYLSQENSPVEDISGFKSQNGLLDMLQRSRHDTVKVVDLFDFTELITKEERDITSRVIELSNIFGRNIGRIFKKTLNEQYVTGTVLGLDMDAIPYIDKNVMYALSIKISRTEKAKAELEAAKKKGNTAANVLAKMEADYKNILRQAALDIERLHLDRTVELRMLKTEIVENAAQDDLYESMYAFGKIVAQKAKVKNDLYSNYPLGLEDKELERLLVKSALSDYEADSAVLETLKAYSAGATARQMYDEASLSAKKLTFEKGASASATVYEIILLYSEKRTDSSLKEKTGKMNTRYAAALLASA